ncbi:MAG TPA: alpha/beta hydrolase [Rhizomicrobium sp.]|jgi:pimeloyl-ACP methyl ester carboxylesterase
MTFFATAADGVRIAYEIAGDQPQAIVLVHGFASDRVQNWRAPGWYQPLNEAGHVVVALDCRGHGESDKPHDPSFYGHGKMADDVIRVMDDAAIGEAVLMGYSMGGYIAMSLLLRHPERFAKVIIGGVGASYLDVNAAEQGTNNPARRGMIADALVTDDLESITNRTAREFRIFAEQAGKDRLALAACMRGNRDAFTKEELGRSTRSVLVVCGESDALTGPPGPLAAAFVDGRAVVVPKRDHMTTVGDKVYKQAVIDFL